MPILGSSNSAANKEYDVINTNNPRKALKTLLEYRKNPITTMFSTRLPPPVPSPPPPPHKKKNQSKLNF